VLDRMGPEKVSAIVAWLAHRECQSEAKIFEAGAGYFAQLNWARSAPLFATEKEGVEGSPLPEHIRDGQDTLHDFAAGDMPRSGDGAMGSPNALEQIFGHLRS
jgi:hypothetical protein